MLALVAERKTIKRKAQVVEELNRMIDEYDIVAVANLHKARASLLQQLSQKFRKDIRMKVAKNNLIKHALKKNRKSSIDKLGEQLTGSNILLLTNMNPFKLAILLEKNKTKMTAKTGDVAPNDIVIPAGNTGLPPGPAISELNEAGIRTKIDMGSVWVVSDTVVVKKGEAIQLKIVSVLSKLGVKPLDVGLELVAAYDGGLVFTSEQLKPRIGETKKNLQDAVSQAFNLAFNSTYPTPETIGMFLQRGYLNARNLAINSNYMTPEVAKDILAKAHGNMMGLASKLAEVNKEAAPAELRK